MASTLLAGLMIGVVSLPYARPAACDLAHRTEHTTHAHHVSVSWAPVAQPDGCEGSMLCGVTFAGPTLEHDGSILPLAPLSCQEAAAPRQPDAPIAAPTTPPPRA